MKKGVNDSDAAGLTFEKLATYRIRIPGALDEHWGDRLGGMSITTGHPEDYELVTSLLGQVAEQAALFGVLNTLYDLHTPILSVECLEKKPKD